MGRAVVERVEEGLIACGCGLGVSSAVGMLHED